MRLICSKGKKKKIKRERAELVNDLRDREQEGPAIAVRALQRGVTGGCLAKALESGECSTELSTVSCLVCFWKGGRHDGEILSQPKPVPLFPLPLGQCVPAQCGINELQNKLLNRCDLMVSKALQI